MDSDPLDVKIVKSQTNQQLSSSKTNDPPTGTGNAVVIIGDSMVKSLGSDLINKAKQIIIHVGTNDVLKKVPQKISDEINILSCRLKEISPEANIAISSLTKRKDDKEGMVDSQLDFIANDNINDTAALNGSDVVARRKLNQVFLIFHTVALGLI